MKPLLFLTLILIPLQIHAQTTGEIAGTVTAEITEKPLAGVNVYVVINQSDTLGAVTDAAGQYRIPNIVADTYHLEATHIGFRKFVIKNITIESGVTLTQDLKLKSSDLSLEEIVATLFVY